MKLCLRLGCVLALTAAMLAGAACAQAQPTGGASAEWQQEFDLSQRVLSPTGESMYFTLKPGYQLVLEDARERMTMLVLDETKEVNGIVTRVVEERSEERGELVEVARNFFAIDEATGDLFYFGEEVDHYRNGRVVGNDGSWLAYRDGQPGLLLPGRPVVGMKYYQEIAPGMAEDRAEVVSTSGTVATSLGVFENCLITVETSELEPGVADQKSYAPGIGLVESGSLRLVAYGYTNSGGGA